MHESGEKLLKETVESEKKRIEDECKKAAEDELARLKAEKDARVEAMKSIALLDFTHQFQKIKNKKTRMKNAQILNYKIFPPPKISEMDLMHFQKQNEKHSTEMALMHFLSSSSAKNEPPMKMVMMGWRAEAREQKLIRKQCDARQKHLMEMSILRKEHEAEFQGKEAEHRADLGRKEQLQRLKDEEKQRIVATRLAIHLLSVYSKTSPNAGKNSGNKNKKKLPIDPHPPTHSPPKKPKRPSRPKSPRTDQRNEEQVQNQRTQRTETLHTRNKRLEGKIYGSGQRQHHPKKEKRPTLPSLRRTRREIRPLRKKLHAKTPTASDETPSTGT